MRLDTMTTRSRRLHDGVVGLSLLAAAAFCAADADGDRRAWVVWLTVALQSALTIAATVYCRRLLSRSQIVPSLSPALLAVIVGSYIWEFFARYALDTGRPFEALVIFSLKNVMLAMAAVSCWGRYGAWALASSLFVAMFSTAMTTSPTVQALVAMYAVGTIAWLTIAYWESLRSRLIEPDRSRRFSRRWAIGALLAAVLLLATVSLGENNVAISMRGWLPSSGGNGESDPFARNGVGDGEALVAGTENITSFAPIDDAPFLQDDKPSLYDIFDDSYDEGMLPNEQDRAIGLPPELASRVKKHLHTRSEKASREFSTLRQSTDSGRKVKDIDSDALFYVAGRTPLHLRLEVYDLFDGIAWYPELGSDERPPIQRIERGGRCWMDVRRFSPGFECFSDSESHAIKVVNLDTNRIPAPLHLTGVHIANVERTSMFNWAQDDIIKMDRERLPALVPIHLSSVVLDRGAVQNEAGTLEPGLNRFAYQNHLTTKEMTRIERLAANWVEGIPRGWPQIIEIERHLRQSYQHAPDVKAVDDKSWPVSQFLFEDRRGPDYQFATAVALMLRSLDYPTRVVSGFYADPAKYDLRSRHTPVHKHDVHFWAEVYIGAGTWATVEPTPGYEVLQPPPGLLAHIWNAIIAFGGWIAAHAVAVSLSGSAAMFGVVYRLDVVDAWLSLRWRIAANAAPRPLALATWRLIAWRMNSSGWRCPEGRTVGGWLTSEDAADFPTRDGLHRLVRLVEWATFASDDSPHCGDSEAVAVCHQAVRQFKRSTLRRSQQQTWRTLMARIIPRSILNSLHPQPSHS